MAAAFAARDAPFGLQTDSDDRDIRLDGRDGALDDGPLREVRRGAGAVQTGGNIVVEYGLMGDNVPVVSCDFRSGG